MGRKINLAKCSGFTLIEIMVSLLILSGALLGVAYLQTWSLQFGQESFNRSQLLSIGNQFIDRMYANQIDADDQNDRDAFYTTAVNLGVDDDCDNEITGARNDLVCFLTEIADSLPSGTAAVTTIDQDNNGSNESYQVTVFWSDKGLTRQADRIRSDYDSISDKSLATQADCNAEINRQWSSDLTWPLGNAPSPATCLVSYSWIVQVYDPNFLGSGSGGIGGSNGGLGTSGGSI